jgi:4-amino-4-deoxy-L-arabinose transferase-like glycosyltransferase
VTPDRVANPARLRIVRADQERMADSAGRSDLLAFGILFIAILCAHLPLLQLPYFWDEAGYYIPAARDLLLTGALVPHSTASSAHPPLVLAYLALWWKVAGFHPAVTRIAMLVIAAVALTGVFRLARRVANSEVAVTTVICTAIYPIFFVQSSLAHLDMAAAALVLWGIVVYLERHIASAVVLFALAALAKETAIITPVALCCWELACHVAKRRGDRRWCAVERQSAWPSLALLIPAVPLAGWFAFHWTRTGHVFGTPGYFTYNVATTMHAARIVLAFLQRVWQLTGHMGMYVLTLATIAAMFYPALREDARLDTGEVRRRISIPNQLVFAVVIVAQLVTMAVVGGALLTRYLLPAYPLFILICISTLRRRVAMWKWVVGIVCFGFVLSLLINPPYRIAPEDNLTYRDFVLLHRDAAQVVQARFPTARILTTWPATDELTRPWLGYVDAPLHTIPIENFSEPEIARARQRDFDLVLLFSTKYETPGGSLFDRVRWWRAAQVRYFDYHTDLPPEEAARALGGRLVWGERRENEWVAIALR